MRRIVADNSALLVHAGNLYVRSVARHKMPLLDGLCCGNPEAEFRTLQRYLLSMDEILFTPQILAELGSTSRRRLQLKPHERRVFLECYRPFLDKCTTKWIKKHQLLRDPDLHLGFADCSVLRLAAREGIPLLTADGLLAETALRRGLEVETLGGLMAAIPRPAS